MGLQCGIVGLPNVGKSTLFNCLTRANVKQENYPFCTIEPNIGIVQVPDKRLWELSKILNPKNTLPTTIEFVDIAGLVHGASKGEGLGNQFLGNIRNCNAIIHVIRCFQSDRIAHVAGEVNPIRDKNTIDTELQLKDLETIEKWQKKYSLKAKSGKKEDKLILSQLKDLYDIISLGKNIRQLNSSDAQNHLIGEMMLLTAKPVMHVCNIEEELIQQKDNPFVEDIKNHLAKENSVVLTLSLEAEREISSLENEEEREFILAEYGLKEPGVNRLIRGAYELLALETFFTLESDIVQAWAFKKGQTARQCAGIIHSDFERGFIRAEVIKYDDFLRYGSENACRENGKTALEGKDYPVDDGDIIRFRFNV